MKHFVAICLVLVVIISACGDASDAAGRSTGSTPPTTSPPTTLAPTPADDADQLGTVGKLLSVALIDEGFTAEEAGCLSREFSATFGEDGLAEMLIADEQSPEFTAAIDEYVVTCLTSERLESFAADASAGEAPNVTASLSCTDPAGDIRSEFSGWTPSIPWGMGDVAGLDFSIADGILSVTLRTQGTHPPTGGPGSTPFVTRMYLVTGDEAGPVAYDVELMRSEDETDPPGPIVVTAVDGVTGEWLMEQAYEDVMTGPGLITAAIPVAAVEPVVAADFWLEIRTEWGPDHPIGSDVEPEWMIDSACDGPHLVRVGRDDAAAGATGESWSPKGLDELIDPLVLVDEGFRRGLPDGWYEQIWMQPADSGGEITVGEGVRFAGLGGSTRSGIMVDLKQSVRAHPHVIVAVSGTVLEQSLAGTGWHGREAPLAVTVTYVDVEGTRHMGLAEDPGSPTNMFYVGFTALPETGMINGVAVDAGEPFIYEFDLMSLDPRPAKIISLGIEGGGWAPRVGEIYEVVLAAGH
jgi:hypothetical protein